MITNICFPRKVIIPIFFNFQKFQKIIFLFFLNIYFFVKNIGEPQDVFLIDSIYTTYLNYNLAVTITK